MKALRLLRLMEKLTETEELTKERLIKELSILFKRYRFFIDVIDADFKDGVITFTLKDSKGKTVDVSFYQNEKDLQPVAEVKGNQIPLLNKPVSYVFVDDVRYLNFIEPSWLDKEILTKILAATELEYEEKQFDKISYDAFGNILKTTY